MSRQCRACGFENMRNRTVCACCGAALVWKGPRWRSGFRPPRAGSGKRWYSLAALFNRLARSALSRLAGLLPEDSLWLQLPEASIVAMLQSVIPGLGLLRRGRTWQAGLYFNVWLLFIFLTWLYFPANMFFLWLNLAMATHILSALLAGDLLRHCRVDEDIWFMVLPVLLIGLILYSWPYIHVGRLAPRVGIVDSEIPLFGLSPGDRVIAWNREATILPGSLVALRTIVRVAEYRNRHHIYTETHALAFVVAGPGGEVRFNDEKMTVNGASMPVYLLPAGFRWPFGESSVQLDEDEYLVWPLSEQMRRDITAQSNEAEYLAWRLSGQTHRDITSRRPSLPSIYRSKRENIEAVANVAVSGMLPPRAIQRVQFDGE